MAEEKKPYSSIVDAFLADRDPDWKDLGLKDAQDSGEEQLDRSHQYIDKEFIDEIAESTSRHTPLWPTTASAEKNAQRERLERARGTHLDRMAAKNQHFSGVGGSDANWRVQATQHEGDYSTKMGDDESLFAEVTETLESAASTGKVEKKNVTDGQVLRYVHDLLNQGMSPTKIAAKLKKLAEIELFNHQMATQYLQENAGLVGMAFLEPNTYMDKNSPTYEREKHGSTSIIADVPEETDEERALRLEQQRKNDARSLSRRGSSNDCVRQHEQWKKAGITPRAASVKQISACEGCQYFSKNGNSKTCGLYHLPVVGNTAELTPIVNKMTAGVPNKHKRAALVQIANGLDGTKVGSMPLAPKTSSSVSRHPSLGSVEAQAKHVGRTAATDFDSSHIATLHEKGHSLGAIFRAADKRFGAHAAGKALREFVGSLKPNVNGQIVLAKVDAEFLAKAGMHNQNFVAGAKCASCATHSVVVMKHKSAAEANKGAEYVSRVPHVGFHESNPEQVRREHLASKPELDASVIERYHKKGHSLEKIYKQAASKFGTAQASKAVKEFIASLKRKPIKIALSQIDCRFLKNKLADHNPIIGAHKCGSCTYRKGMHCGLTGGTLLSFPGMDKTSSNHKVAEGAPEDGRTILAEYDLMPNSGRPGDTKMADINMNTDRPNDTQMGTHFEMGDIE